MSVNYIGLLGLGHVGSGVYDIIKQNDYFNLKAKIKRILVRNKQTYHPCNQQYLLEYPLLFELNTYRKTNH